jgi:N-acetylneuraminic acid mutarotase
LSPPSNPAGFVLLNQVGSGDDVFKVFVGPHRQLLVVSRQVISLISWSYFHERVIAATAMQQHVHYPERDPAVVGLLFGWLQDVQLAGFTCAWQAHASGEMEPFVERVQRTTRQGMDLVYVGSELRSLGLDHLCEKQQAVPPPPIAEPNRMAVYGGRSEDGQLDTVYVYDPVTDSWKAGVIPNLPLQTHDHAVAVAGGKAYLFGGRDADDAQLDVAYSIGSDREWTALPLPMPKARYGHCVVDFFGQLLVIGGYNDVKLASCDRFDPQASKWHTLPSMISPRMSMSAVVLQDKVFVFGGWADNGTLKSMEVFDPKADTWTEGPPMHCEREGGMATTCDGKIYVFGGINADEEQLQSVECYDPMHPAAWILLDATVPGDGGRSLGGCMTIEGKIYIAGGFTGGRVSTSCLRFDPRTEEFSAVQDLPHGVQQFATSGA